ncbi:AAA family ATPase [Ectopseudomonas mendocina]|uniref:AAA family ATPase n=1 Tax=Ectopseudomonas mendocina TaxID=300 RepID=UPI001ADFC243|nr:AAA family ATPase [Pseudomonas mendocina]QTN45561.1 AAA family ATPase [Pseudomonas mendocina]
MLKSIEVSGFKSIKKQKIELGRINVFIGSNGVGKSNILEAVGMLSAAMSGSISYPILAAKGVRSSAPEIYRTALKGRRPKYFDLHADFDGVRYNCSVFSQKNSSDSHWKFHSESFQRKKSSSGKYETFAGRSGRGIKVGEMSFAKESHGNDTGLMALLSLIGGAEDAEMKKFDSLSDYAIYSPFTNVLRGVSSDSSGVRPLGLFGGNLAGALSEALRQKDNSSHLMGVFKLFPWIKGIGYGYFSDLASNSDRGSMPKEQSLIFRDKYMQEGIGHLYAADVSEGALYVMFILALLLHDKSPEIFALDNVDSSLNPGLVKGVVELIARLSEVKGKQLLLTTHNPTALDGIDLFNDEHRLFVVDRNSDTGETEINRLQPSAGATRESWMEDTGGAQLSELWLNGYLGGFAGLNGF